MLKVARLLLVLYFTSWTLGASAGPQKFITWQGLTGYARFSPRGKSVIRLSDRTLEIWSLGMRQPMHRLSVSQPLVDAQMTPDGAYLTAGSEEGVYTIWRMADFRRIYAITDPPTGGAHQPFALSPDGSRLAICKLTELTLQNQFWLDFHLHLWDVARARRVGRIFVVRVPNRMPGHLPAVSVAWHPLGRYLTTAMEWDEGSGQPIPNSIQVRDTWKGRWLYWVPGALPAEYSQSGEYFAFLAPLAAATAAGQGIHWQVKLWNTRVNRLKTLPSARSVGADAGLTLSPDGNYLAYIVPVSGLQKQVVVHSTRSLGIQQAFRIPEAADSLSFSFDSGWLLVSSFADPTFPVRLYSLKHP